MDLRELNRKEKDKQHHRKRNADLTSMVYGKIPPQAKELEEASLGACMLERGAFDVLSEIIRPECFYVEAHQRIFKAMQSLSQKSSPIDILTVVEELRFREELEMIGGPFYVTKLTNSVVSSAHIEAHSRIILQKFIQREIIRISGELIQLGYEDSTDAFDLIDDAESMIMNLSLGNSTKSYVSMDQGLIENIQRIDELRTLDSHITGVRSGFRDIDNVTHGWQDTDLIILAARPGVGKTALALNLARNAWMNNEKKVPVGIFSLEMSRGQLIDRLMSSESEIYIDYIMNGRLSDEQYKKLHTDGIKKLADAKIFIDDTPALNIYELRTRARKMKRKENVGLIIIDYLQLMNGGSDQRNGNREQEISKISRDLKSLAKELRIPIIALSQLSRAPETRKNANKMPVLSDLRESGAIEQDADMVVFMYRPEYYDVNATDLGESIRGETHVRIAKHRHGKLETIKLVANLDIQKFSDWDSMEEIKQHLSGGSWKPLDEKPKEEKKTPPIDDLPF